MALMNKATRGAKVMRTDLRNDTMDSAFLLSLSERSQREICTEKGQYSRYSSN